MAMLSNSLMDDAGMQTCLKHENMLVPVQNHWERTHVHILDITVIVWQGLR